MKRRFIFALLKYLSFDFQVLEVHGLAGGGVDWEISTWIHGCLRVYITANAPFPGKAVI